jgi:hypothetical protein
MDMTSASLMFPAQAVWSFSDDMQTSMYPGMSLGSSLLAEERR